MCTVLVLLLLCGSYDPVTLFVDCVLRTAFILCAQKTIVKKASAMLDGNSTIHRCHRLHYAYLSRNSSSWGPGTSAGGGGGGGMSGGDSSSSSSSYLSAAAAGGAGGAASGVEIEHSFGRPLVLAKLGQYIMDIKVRLFFFFLLVSLCLVSSSYLQ
jgi:hypothetical protein